MSSWKFLFQVTWEKKFSGGLHYPARSVALCERWNFIFHTHPTTNVTSSRDRRKRSILRRPICPMMFDEGGGQRRREHREQVHDFGAKRNRIDGIMCYSYKDCFPVSAHFTANNTRLFHPQFLSRLSSLRTFMSIYMYTHRHVLRAGIQVQGSNRLGRSRIIYHVCSIDRKKNRLRKTVDNFSNFNVYRYSSQNIGQRMDF